MQSCTDGALPRPHPLLFICHAPACGGYATPVEEYLPPLASPGKRLGRVRPRRNHSPAGTSATAWVPGENRFPRGEQKR